MTNRSRKSRQRTAIFHFSLVICHFADAICHCSFAISAVVRKNVAPASSRQTVLLTQKELSRLTCRRDAGATILSHDQRLCGEAFGSRLGCTVFICVHLWFQLARGERRESCERPPPGKGTGSARPSMFPR